MANLESADDYLQYASFGAEIDLKSVSEVSGATHCREIIVNDAGSSTKLLVVKTPKGTTRTLTVANGERYPIKATAITTATTAARITVLW